MLRSSFAALLLAAGCASSSPASGPAPGAAPGAAPRAEATVDTLRLGVGESVERGGETLLFVGVVEDSRCPEDVECVWAGTASVQVEVAGESVVVTLPHPRADAGETATLTWAGTAFTFADLTPYPGSEAARRDEPVVATFTPAR